MSDSGFHEKLRGIMIAIIPWRALSPLAKAAQIRISKQTRKIEQLTVAVTIRLRVASFLQKAVAGV